MNTNATSFNNTTPGNETYTDEMSTTLSDVDIAVKTILGVISLTGLVGNLLIAIIILKRRHLQTPTNWLFFNLAVSDLAIVTITIPMVIVVPLIDWPFQWIGCKYLIMPVMEHFAGVCVLTHTAISFARYAVLANRANQHCGLLKLTRILIITIWVISFLVMSAPLMGIVGEFELVKSHGRLACNLKWTVSIGRQIYRVFVFILTYVIPMVTTGYSYYRIHSIVYNSLRHVNGFLPVDILHSRRQKSRRMDRMLTAMYIMFALTTLPLQVFLTFYDFGVIPEDLAHAPFLFTVFLLMFYLQILVQPAVLLYKGEEFKKALDKMSKTQGCCWLGIFGYKKEDKGRDRTCSVASRKYKHSMLYSTGSFNRDAVTPECNGINYSLFFFSPGLNEILEANKVPRKRSRLRSFTKRRGLSTTSIRTDITELSVKRKRSNPLQRNSSKRSCNESIRKPNTSPLTVDRNLLLQGSGKINPINSVRSCPQLLGYNTNGKGEAVSNVPYQLLSSITSTESEKGYERNQTPTTTTMISVSSLQDECANEESNQNLDEVFVQNSSTESRIRRIRKSGRIELIVENNISIYPSILSPYDCGGREGLLSPSTFEKGRLSDVLEVSVTENSLNDESIPALETDQLVEVSVPGGNEGHISSLNRPSSPTHISINSKLNEDRDLDENLDQDLNECQNKKGDNDEGKTKEFSSSRLRKKTISFIEDDRRVLIPVSAFENIHFWDSDDTYLHLPSDLESYDEEYKETII